ncbi:MFS transporter [Clostridium cadaveris]|uniref:MFS transporter n=1 Tax=Clostridium cadaveris TaxID=1529 RepID=UPI001E3F523E|nr:MFS transporter [Clostridium cadaveris]UFH63653.1 MFS transporter [Clostridium cadaveris]
MSNIKTTSGVAIPLTPKKRILVQTGCVCLMLSIAMLGLSLSVLQGPILTEMNAMQYFSLLTIFASLGLVIMTPIGGKLGDIFGRRNVVIVAGTIATICGIGMCLVKTVVPFMVLRLIIGAAQGAFTAAPYIIAREINEAKDVPKAMGILASSVAIGGFVGSIIAGALTDAGLLGFAIAFPVIPLIIGVILIALNLPNKKQEVKVKIDVLGIVVLTITISTFVLPLNFGTMIGWTNPWIICGFILMIVFGMILVKVENKATDPIIPMRLFKNKQYTSLLLVGFLAYFYMNAMNVYAPLAVQQVLNGSTTISGILQMPRTIITMILPALVGVWVGKKRDNFWKGMAISAALVTVSLIPLCFIGSSTSVIMMIALISVTGIAESLRGVTVTAAAQSTLDPKDMGVGTSLVNFCNSASGLVAAALGGAFFNVAGSNIALGVNYNFMISVVSAILEFLIVAFIVRRFMRSSRQDKEVVDTI